LAAARVGAGPAACCAGLRPKTIRPPAAARTYLARAELRHALGPLVRAGAADRAGLSLRRAAAHHDLRDAEAHRRRGDARAGRLERVHHLRCARPLSAINLFSVYTKTTISSNRSNRSAAFVRACATPLRCRQAVHQPAPVSSARVRPAGAGRRPNRVASARAARAARALRAPESRPAQRARAAGAQARRTHLRTCRTRWRRWRWTAPRSRWAWPSRCTRCGGARLKSSPQPVRVPCVQRRGVTAAWAVKLGMCKCKLYIIQG